ncbi:MAG: CaiB/BaiF CoA-transferase family protein [Anaerolineae bacterium]|nr:MAG: CaiB/BaiF CoA-transferase family protein [Anaerolineae bacterium]
MSDKALEGIRVVDLSRVLAGPYCTMMLGDLGAEVIKVEQPGSGDGARQWGPPWVGDESAYFLSANRNKKSMTLNLKHTLGQRLVRELIASADVLVENFRPGTTAKLGLDYETLAGELPSLIYCSITGYGQNGPYRERSGYDFMIQAQGGLLSITGPEGGPPSKVGVAIVDITAGLYASSAILAALFHRKQTGEGQHIDIALFDAQVAWLANVAHSYFATGAPPQRYGNAHANIVPYETFPTSDGLLAVAVGTDAQFERLCTAVGREDLGEDPRYRTNADRVEYRGTLVPELQRVFRQRTAGEWIELLLEHRVPVAPVNDIPTVLNDPQVLAREMVQEVEHSSLGTIQQLGPVPKMSRTPARVRKAPPTLGEDTESLLLNELGCTPTDIENLRAQAVI